MSTTIYADNAATTRLSDKALEAMLPYLKESYGNASTLYQLGRSAHSALEDARKRIAGILGCSPMEIFFVSCGTEADNWAVKGIAHKLAKDGKKHLITSVIEHHGVLHSMQVLEKEGFTVTYLPVDSTGRVDPDALEKAIRPDTALVSIMYANNEIGTIQPVEEIGRICHEHGVLFHTDAVQAVGTLPIDVNAQNIDLLSLSAHKFYGPKGIGALYCRKGIFPAGLIDGGGQERGHRSGTENVASIVGMAAALEEAVSGQEDRNMCIAAIRDRVQEGLLAIPDCRLNGNPEHRLPGILNVSFAGIDGQSMLFSLDLKGLAASSGSACTSGSINPSHVLLSLGIPYELAHGSLRLSFGKHNTMEEAEQIIKIVTDTICELRANNNQ